MTAKVTVEMEIYPGGAAKILTVKGAGGECRKVADLIGRSLGTADEASRENTPDLFETTRQANNELGNTL